MGGLLAKPVTTKVVERKHGVHGRGGVATMQGFRINHEDAHVMEMDVNGSILLAVLDGHGGQGVAAVASRIMKTHFQQSDLNNKEMTEKLTDICLAIDDECAQAVENHDQGSTCIIAYIIPDGDEYDIYFANLGDSRALLIRDNEIIEATIDHKPDAPEESRRILAAGGTVDGSPARVDDNLALSRAFGDWMYKCDEKLEPKDQKVSIIPEVYHMRGHKDDQLFLACDGIFDVMSNEEVVKYLKSKVHEEDEGDLMADLLKHCLDLQSNDNMTAMIFNLGLQGKKGQPTESVELKKAVASDDQSQQHENKFAKAHGFIEQENRPCCVCNKVFLKMQQCPCKGAFYCGLACQSKNWEQHRDNCSAATGKAAKRTPTTAAA